MRNFLLSLAVALLLLPFTSFGQFTYHQYFDGDDTSPDSSLVIEFDTTVTGNVWQVGVPQKSIFDSAASIPNVIVTDTVDPYPANDTSSFLFGIQADPFGFGIIALQWMQKLDMDQGFDGGVIEYSSDTGRTWESLMNSPYAYNFFGFETENLDSLQSDELAFTGTDSTWRNIWLCVDGSWLSTMDSTLFRFTFKSDSIDNQREGWMIDNMLVHRTYVHTINETKTEKYMRIFPNPTTGRVNIETRKITGLHLIEKIELINMRGETVQEFGVSPTKFYIDIDHHPHGMYLLKIYTTERTETFQVILKDE